MHVVLAISCAATKLPCIQPCSLDRADICRADIGGCVSGCTYINRVESPQNVCRGSSSVEECIQAHQGTCRYLSTKTRLKTDRLKTDRLVSGALKLLLLAICILSLRPKQGLQACSSSGYSCVQLLH